MTQPVKDYYSTLQISPQASSQDIKKAYRKMALRYHPDKHPDDLYAAAYFAEIQEAYKILIDPLLRSQYHQQRWLSQSQGKTYQDLSPATPQRFAQACVRLREWVQDQDEFRINRPALLARLLQILSKSEIEMMRQFQDDGTMLRCMDLLTDAVKPLTEEEWQICKPHFLQLAGHHPRALDKIAQVDDLIAWKKRASMQQWLAVLGVTLLVCVMIYFLSK